MKTPHPFEAQIARALDTYSLLPQPPVTVVVALSGGADSTALLVALHTLGYNCIAAHCNFHLRGDESNRDMQHCAALCRQLGVDLCIKHFDTQAYAARHGLSIEMAARQQRYAWFDDQVDRHKAAAVAVAHHADDNVETYFLNLLRGSGIAGLCGMPRRRGIIIRPMLDMPRSLALEYLRQRGIAWVDDSTNAHSDYRRNRLRNQVLPVIDDNFAEARAQIQQAMRHLADARAIYDQAVAEKRAAYVDAERHAVALDALAQAEPQAATLLYEWLKPLGYSHGQAQDMLGCRMRTGAHFEAVQPDGTLSVAVVDRGRLLLQSQWRPGGEPDAYPVDLEHDILAPVHIAVTRHRVATFRPERNAAVAYFDVRMLAGNPLFELRHWRRGDRMRPFGMPPGTSRLVSDIFSDAHYSLLQKRQAWLLTRDGEILWVAGLRAAAAWPIGPDTRHYLRLDLR